MISEHEAVDRARLIAEQNGWIWVEPAQVTWYAQWFGSGGKWEIYSNGNGLGAKVRVVIDADTGTVLEKGYIPR